MGGNARGSIGSHDAGCINLKALHDLGGTTKRIVVQLLTLLEAAPGQPPFALSAI